MAPMAVKAPVLPQGLADCRGDIKLPDFTGRNEDWSSWVVKARAIFTIVGWDGLVDAAELEAGQDTLE